MSSPSASPESRTLYLGVDCSTQSLKLTVVTRARQILARVTVAYTSDELRAFRAGTPDGLVRGSYGIDTDTTTAAAASDDKQEHGTPATAAAAVTGPLDSRDASVVTTPSLLFVGALELGLTRLRATGVPMERIRCLSASGQQHGSVWWARGASTLLADLHAEEPFARQLAHAFALPYGPIWMDASTRDECRALEKALAASTGAGGDGSESGSECVARRTGSRACARFTGPQIARVSRVHPREYARTEHISLVSSLIPSLFLGRYAEIDASDAAGMNLMDINPSGLPFEWDSECLEVTAAHAAGGVPELRRKLGAIVDSLAHLGCVSPAMCARFGFSPECEVVVGSGDNPCSLVGMGLTRVGDLGVSLGTSDTLFAIVPTATCRPSGAFGHVFPNPSDVVHTRMVLVCARNGSRAREMVKAIVVTQKEETEAEVEASLSSPSSSSSNPCPSSSAAAASSSSTSWSSFNALIRSTPIGGVPPTSASSSSASAASFFFFAYPECEITPCTRRAGWFVWRRRRGRVEGRGGQEQEEDNEDDDDERPWIRADTREEFERQWQSRTSPSASSTSVVLSRGSLARGVIESQVLNLRLHSLRLGLQQPKRLVVTGGASVNEEIVQILADVFGCPVEGQSVVDDRTGRPLGRVSDTASLGAAFRALDSHELRHAYELSAEAATSPMPEGQEDSPQEEDDAPQPATEYPPSPSGSPMAASPSTSLARPPLSPQRVLTCVLATPRDEAHRAYTGMLEEYEACQRRVVDLLNEEEEAPSAS